MILIIFWLILSLLLMFFFKFKYDQAQGRYNLNDIFIDFGGGSFFRRIFYALATLFWEFLYIITFITFLIILLIFFYKLIS